MNEKLLFDSFAGWYGYLWKACKTFVKGLLKIVYSLFGGVASVFVWLYGLIAAFCKREFVASVIIGAVIVALSLGWVSTYMNGRVAVKTAEYQRDSIGHRLDKMMQAYDSATLIVVDNDTLYNAK